jgi:hypothetical protein
MEQMADQATIEKIISGDTGTKLSSKSVETKQAESPKVEAIEAELKDTPGQPLEAN